MQDLKKSLSKKSNPFKSQPLLSPAKTNLDDLQEGVASLNSLEDSFVQPNESLKRFLATLEIEIEDVIKLASEQGQDPEILLQSLQVLFDSETARCAWVKWATLDHAVEKNLQWPFLSVVDIGGTREKGAARLRPKQRSILLKRPSALRKAYSIRGFVKGVEYTLAQAAYYAAHFSIYNTLLGVLNSWIKTGDLDMSDLLNSGVYSSQKSVVTLALAIRLDEALFKLILNVPILVGVAFGTNALCSTRKIDEIEVQNIANKVNTRLKQRGSFCRDTLQEYLPLISHICSLSRKIEKLERGIRWDGRLSAEERLCMFRLIHSVAMEGNQLTQIYAMECLAKIVHGIGFKDLPKLQKSGYDKRTYWLFYIQKQLVYMVYLC